jgi:cytoskeletal protein CcmA (bactofilin family)
MALFGTNGQDQPMTTKRQTGLPVPDQINMVGEGTVFEGTLHAESDVRISGRVVGTLHVRGKVIVAPEGIIDGELVATNADVAGQVKGDITVEERLMLKSSASIDANIKVGRFVMEEGAVFNGDCQMGASRSGTMRPMRGMAPETTDDTAPGDLTATGS